LLALADLRQGDRFNVIDFDSDARALFTQSRVVDSTSINEARDFVNGLQAEGGTEMLKALQLAIPGQTQPGVVRQVVFMTDGQVGNEQELFSYIRQQLGDSRLFTVGIGSAPNSHFMSNAARFGRGTFTYIGDIAQVKERMGELVEKLSAPAMTSSEGLVVDPTAEIWPSRVPDLYSGEPLLVAVQVIDPSAPIVIRGKIGNEPWVRRLKFPDPIEDSGIARLWARQKIETTMDKLSEGVDLAMIRKEVVPIALRHHLVSQFTSLVAVDQSPQGLSGATCRAELEPETGNGTLEQHAALHSTATPAQLLLMLGVFLIAIALAAVRWVW
jgi:Ca-activated chloride channel family protein